MTCSSSATSPCSYQTRREPGSSTSLPHRSTTGTTWLGSSLGIFRARTYVPETPGTLRVAARNQASLSEISSGASPSSAPSCPVSVTRRSSRLSSPAPPRQDREASARPEPARAPIAHRVPMLLDRLDNRHEGQGDHEVVGRRRRHNGEGPARGYHVH